LAIVGGFILDINRFEFLAVILASGMVLSAEAFNTAIEVLADKVDGTYDERTRILKDIAASAVLLTAIAALLTGIIVFLPKILHLIFQ
jgi:diacylglycerol kinase